jgi:hypothetical protein
MGKIMLPSTVIKQVYKYRKQCMWRGARKPPLEAWQLATRPQKGGLGILNIET